MRERAHFLELAVSRRTDELTSSRQQIREMVAYQDRLREEERAHIAREIHDELGQYLTALRLDTAMLQVGLANQHPELAERAATMKGLIDHTIGVVRSVATRLRPGALDLGLVSAAEWLINDFKSRTGVECYLHVPADDLQLPDSLSTTLFRILQESLTNVTRHARASMVNVRIEPLADEIHLHVWDDGVGFDPVQAAGQKTYGLMGIRERVFMLGGSARIDSSPGEGTSLSVRLPWSTAATHSNPCSENGQ